MILQRQRVFSEALNKLESFQNKVQDVKIRANKKLFGDSKLGRMGRNNLEVQRAKMTNGTKNLKILLGE